MNKPPNKLNWKKLDTFGQREGFLVDKEIKRAMEDDLLISEGAEIGAAKYACYELHIGEDLRRLMMGDVKDNDGASYVGVAANAEGKFHINPTETFVVYSREKLYVPADVFAIAIPVGNLYRLGLSPETTFADPGFNDYFFVTICNYSPRVVELKVGAPIARLFFFKLAGRPDLIHEGNPRELAPTVSRVKRPSDETLEKKGHEELLDEILKKTDPPHYEHAFLTRKIFMDHHVALNNRIDELYHTKFHLTVLTYLSSMVISFIFLCAVLLGLIKLFPELGHHVLEDIVATGLISIGTGLLGPPVIKALKSMFGNKK